MKRIHADKYAPKYYCGKWSWDKKKDCLHFEPHNDLENVRERYVMTNGYKFLRTINQEEELIFRHEYVRSESTFDADTVVINDIIDLTLFLMPSEFLTFRFVEFMHKPAVHRLIHALIIYFEYFLRMVEFVLIRRDELSGKLAQVQSEQTNEQKRIFSIYLSQYRMLVARNYSIIIKGENDMQKYYHMTEIVNISATIKDKYFHEQFLAVCTQIIWICMHRRAYNVIEMEMNRLFRSEHFIMKRQEYLSFTAAERSLLYGRYNKIVNYRTQISPLVQELEHIADEDLPILWIGERKYRGTDTRIAEIELEYIVPGPQLRMIDVAHGILGHPKRLYNTLLDLDWPSVRYSNFSYQDDPYHIIRQPYLKIPKIDAIKMRKASQNFEHFYKVYRIYEPCSRQKIFKWLRRDKIIQLYRSGGLLTNIISRCEKELADTTYGPKVEQIIANYFKVKSRLRKRASHAADDTLSVATSQFGSIITNRSLSRKKSNALNQDHFFED
ncbi:protein phosphatase 1 regulatory subunit 36 [Drosophila tropicalis]|uniref:protein phosphatase 1 regulatory subunit 36 n=1 Tax=Drosophila tropicalis TaxID=46794 RepID=UPI0035ABCE01